jgi:hypothetical protein
MKVKKLIELLKKQDPEKEVMIQQGEEYDYMTVENVRTKKVTNWDDVVELIEFYDEDDDGLVESVVIEYVP